MSEWRDIRLGEFVQIQRGHDLPERLREPGHVPVMGSFGITGNHSTAKESAPGVTIGRSGASIGVVSYVEKDYWPLNTCLFVKDFCGNNPRFVYYFLRTLDLASHNSGSAQPSLNRNLIYPIRIRVPRRKIQDEVAELLGALDDKIDVNRRMSETLRKMSSSVFQEWFVDVGPIRAKEFGIGSYMSEEIWRLFPCTTDKTGLPQTWAIGKIGDLVSWAQNGGTPARKNVEYWSSSGIPWFKTAELADDYLVASEEFITKEGARAIGNKVWPPGTILFAIYASPTLGRMGILSSNASANQACTALGAKPEYGVPYLFESLRHARGELQNLAVGSAQQNISKKALLEHKCVIPEAELARAFSETVQPLYRKAEINTHENSTLSIMRDLLLPRLMSGQVAIKDMEKEVAEVV